LKGQDILHIDVYDEDLIFDDKIGSVKINLQELYSKRKSHSNENFSFGFFLKGISMIGLTFRRNSVDYLMDKYI
jgi:Ca2+-dependent lipid-binding protein